MRQVVPVTDAAIAAGVAPRRPRRVLPGDARAARPARRGPAAGCRIVPGCGVAPGLTNILARLGADRLDRVDAIADVLVHHASDVDLAGHRRDALRCEHRHLGRPARTARSSSGRRSAARSGSTSPSRTASRRSTSSRTPSRSPCRARIDVRERRVQGRLPGRRDAAHPRPARAGLRPRRAVRGRRRADLAAARSRRRTSAAAGSARMSAARMSSTSGSRACCAGRPRSLTYDFAVEPVGRSASSTITGTVAAIAADMVARGGEPASTRPRPRSTRGRSSRRWPNGD